MTFMKIFETFYNFLTARNALKKQPQKSSFLVNMNNLKICEKK